jgi:hypothetical protein
MSDGGHKVKAKAGGAKAPDTAILSVLPAAAFPAHGSARGHQSL